MALKDNFVPPELVALVKANFGDYSTFSKFMTAYGVKYAKGSVPKLVFTNQPSATLFFHSVANWAASHGSITKKQFTALSACVQEAANLGPLVEWMSANAKNYLTPMNTAAEHVAAAQEKPHPTPEEFKESLSKAKSALPPVEQALKKLAWKHGDQPSVVATTAAVNTSSVHVVFSENVNSATTWSGYAEQGDAPVSPFNGHTATKKWVPDVSEPAGGHYEMQHDQPPMTFAELMKNGPGNLNANGETIEEYDAKMKKKWEAHEKALKSGPPFGMPYGKTPSYGGKEDHFEPPKVTKTSLGQKIQAEWHAAKEAEVAALRLKVQTQILNLLRYKASRDPLLDELGF